MRSRFACAMTIAAFSLLPQFGEAADGKGKLVATDLSMVDEDFSYQGEYVGYSILASGGSYWAQTGLQLVAMGNGEFQAVAYVGGLPGAGWNRQPPARLTAQRSGNVLNLDNGLRLSLRGTTASVLTGRGLFGGTVRKTIRRSPTLGLRAPSYADVLFNGTNTDAFKNGKMNDAGHLMVGTEFAKAYGDFQLHIEFMLPYMPEARGQGRSNSGVYIHSRYEVQVLDSFGLNGEFNECAALYRQRKPDLNMCLPPLTWQTYDITFRAARFDEEGQKTENARITVKHNGVAVHNNVEIVNKTGAGAKEGPKLLPIKLQNHSNPVVFRNIWIADSSKSRPATYCQPVRCVPCRTVQPTCRTVRKCK